jgi:gas vesicle protein
MRKTFFLLMGVLSGALVGAAAALLLTPYSGKEVQGQLRSRVQGLLEAGREAAATRGAELQAQWEAFKHGSQATSAE